MEFEKGIKKTFLNSSIQNIYGFLGEYYLMAVTIPLII